MSEKIGNEKIERESGFLYYLGKDGRVWRSPMKSNSKGKKGAVSSEKIEREAGFLYFIDKKGFVSRVAMKRGKKKGKK